MADLDPDDWRVAMANSGNTHVLLLPADVETMDITTPGRLARPVEGTISEEVNPVSVATMMNQSLREVRDDTAFDVASLVGLPEEETGLPAPVDPSPPPRGDE